MIAALLYYGFVAFAVRGYRRRTQVLVSLGAAFVWGFCRSMGGR